MHLGRSQQIAGTTGEERSDFVTVAPPSLTSARAQYQLPLRPQSQSQSRHLAAPPLARQLFRGSVTLHKCLKTPPALPRT